MTRHLRPLPPPSDIPAPVMPAPDCVRLLGLPSDHDRHQVGESAARRALRTMRDLHRQAAKAAELQLAAGRMMALVAAGPTELEGVKKKLREVNTESRFHQIAAHVLQNAIDEVDRAEGGAS